MTMLSPAATYQAELRQTPGVGRALSVQPGLVRLAHGLAAATRREADGCLSNCSSRAHVDLCRGV
jgi:hypothetical protein